MKRYDVLITWMEVRGSRGFGYSHKSQWHRGIVADDIVAASKIALDQHAGKICAGVSMIWPQYPQ